MLKILFVLIFILFTFAVNAQQKCILPVGQYTPIEDVLNQFVLNDGNPNWGDWCFDSGYGDYEVEACVKELYNWDAWLKCAGLSNN